MTFLDTNVVMYAVGRPHPLREKARAWLRPAYAADLHLVTSAEVLQELLHAYLPVGRTRSLDRAFRVVRSVVRDVWPVEEDDVHLARLLAEDHGDLSARDLVNLAVCRRREVRRIRTFDRTLEATFED